MKAIILAAGMGTRLGDTFPKPMISLKNEETILDFQIKHIAQYIPVDNIIVVVGFKKELLMEKYPELAYVYNHNYAQTNTAKSLLCALKKINEDAIWMNGDVYFDKFILKQLLSEKNSSILVQKKICGEEEIKFTVDKKGFVHEISKKIYNSVGEAVGINLIKRKDISVFIKHLEKVGPKDYFEKAIENMIKKDKVKVAPIDIKKLFCVEIDFPEDLKKVKTHLKG